MKIDIDCYGVTARHTGAPRVTLELNADATAGDALHALGQRYADLAPLLRQCAIGRGDALIRRSEPLQEGDVIALLPPVAGG
jgi:molybdopterin converting factor small subunit